MTRLNVYKLLTVLFALTHLGLGEPIYSQANSSYGSSSKRQDSSSSEEESSFIEAKIEVNSDFIFRGESFGGDFVNQRNNRSYRSYTDAWTFQPDILFHTPLKGFKVLIWGNLNLQHRRDRDSDSRIFQDGPGMPERFFEVYDASQGGNLIFDPRTTRSYKEQNGLHRQDGAFLGAYYEWEHNLGTFQFGAWIWNNANRAAKYTWQEWFLVYKPAVLEFLNPTLSMYFNTSSSNLGNSNNPPNITNGQNYISLDLSHTFMEEEFFRVQPSVHIGYIVNNDNVNQKSGISNITSGLKFFLGEFYVGGFWVHRPDRKIWDTQDKNPRDGKIADPSKQNGLINTTVYRELDQVYYNQPILRDYLKDQYQSQNILTDLFFISLGYQVRF